ncbi:MAG: cation:dicarboxylase symporter family transporter [Elusimicrobiota bacterium]
MAGLRRLIALSLILAQCQEAFATTIRAAVPVHAGAGNPAAAVVGVVGLQPIGTPGLSLSLSPPLTNALPSVHLRPEFRIGAAASPPRVEAVRTGIPVSAPRPVAAKPLLRERQKPEAPRASLPALESLAAPERSAPAASDSASGDRAGRFAAMFDGAMKEPAPRFDAPVAPAEPGSRRPSLLSRLRAPGPRTAPGVQAPLTRKKASSRWALLTENRFLIAAAAGAALGFAGVDLGALPVLSLTPGLFFGVLPWLAAPFIGLNVYSSFSHYSVVKESRTLLGFLVITAAGLAISAGVTIAMTALLPVVDPAGFAAVAIPGLADGGFSPMQFMLPIIGAFTGAALLYKRARSVNDGSARREYPPGWKGALLRISDKAAGLVVNGRTAPFLEKAGKLGEKGTALINRFFPIFIDVVGLPAVATLLSMTLAAGGLGLLSSFGGYYITAFAGMAVGMVALLAAYFAFGARAKDFKAILKAALVGFSISSSSATMPTEKEALKAMGVSRKTRNAVVPLGGVFNMFGTSLYMGLTAFYALSMFGAAPTLMQYLYTALTVLVIAMGAPGIPASNITLLEPVLRQTGLQPGEINKVYTMILPADRVLDMAQTALNVLGDMLPAVEQDRERLRYVRAKRIREIRRKRAEEGR